METLPEELARLGASVIGSDREPEESLQRKSVRMYFTVVACEIRNRDESEDA